MSCRKFFRRSLRVDDTRRGLFYQHTRPSIFSYRHSQCKPSVHRFRDGRSNSICVGHFPSRCKCVLTSQSGRSLTARRKGEPRGPTSRWRRKPTPKHPCSRSLQPDCRIATLDLTNGLGIEDTTIASDAGLGPLAKSLWGIIKPVDRHPSSVSAGGGIARGLAVVTLERRPGSRAGCSFMDHAPGSPGVGSSGIRRFELRRRVRQAFHLAISFGCAFARCGGPPRRRRGAART